MNKKGTKKLSGVLAATTVLTSVAGATPVFAQGTNWDALYKTAYEAMQKAEKEKTQESINVARKAIAEVAKNKKLVSMASTLSEKVDAVQQGLFNDLYALMYVDGKPKANMTQEEINKAKALVVSFATCPSNKAYIPTWSSAIDPYQQKNIDKLVEAIKTAETTKKAEDIKAARKLANEFLTVTNADMKKAAEGLDVQLAQVEAPEAVKAVEAIKVNELKLENQKEVQAQLDNAKKLAEKVKDEKVKKELTDKIAKSEKAINDKFVALEKLNVEKATVTHANTIKVELSKAVKAEEQAKTNFVVKRGNINISVSAKWTKDGKSVELVAGNAFVAGDYSILATSGEAIATAKVKVEERKETSLTIDSSVLNKGIEDAEVKVSLKDQYGDEFELKKSDFTVTAYNKTQSAVITPEFKDKNFVINTKKAEKEDKVLVTVMHNKTGKTVQKDLNVVGSAYVDTITLGKVELSKEDKNGLTAISKNVKVEYEAKDQFGNAIELSNDNIEIISSDSSILSVAGDNIKPNKENNKSYFNIKDFTGSGKVVLTIMSKASGKTARVELDVKEAPGKIANVKVKTSDVTVAANSTQAIELEVTDQYGKKLKDYKDDFELTSSNPLVVGKPEIKDGKVEFKVLENAKKDTKTIITIVNNKTGKVAAIINVTAGEKAVATNIELKAGVKPATTLAVGAKTKVEFVVKDQYGNVMDGQNVTIKDQAKLSKIGIVQQNKNEIEVEAKAEGSEKLVVNLGDNGDSKEITFNVVKNVSTMDLKVSKISSICKDGEDKQEINVETKDKIKLPSSSIVGVEAITNNLIVEEGKDKEVGKYFVKANLSEEEQKNLKNDVTGKISVIYNADDKVVTLEQTITISAKDRKVEKVLVLDQPLENNTIKDDAKAITSVKSLDELSKCNIIEQDNFGSYKNANFDNKDNKKEATIVIASEKGLKVDTRNDNVELKNGKITIKSEAITATEGSTEGSFRVIVFANGNSAVIDVNLKGIKDDH